MSSVELDCDESGSCDILLDGKQIGIIEGTFSILAHIEIEEAHRNSGHGYNAVKQYVDAAARHGITRIETTAVIHPACERILDELGFVPDPQEPSHYTINTEDTHIPA